VSSLARKKKTERKKKRKKRKEKMKRKGKNRNRKERVIKLIAFGPCNYNILSCGLGPHD
jgi:hypothetical protein